MLSFKPAFSFSSFTYIKRLFSSSLLFYIRVVSSAYLRLLIFLPVIVIPACASSNPAFLMMYSAYKLKKQGDNIQPWCTSFPIWNQSIVSLCSRNHVKHCVFFLFNLYTDFSTVFSLQMLTLRFREVSSCVHSRVARSIRVGTYTPAFQTAVLFF